MFRDSQTALYEAAALVATGDSTNTYDLGAPFATGTANGAQVDPGNGEPLGIVISVGVAAKVSGTTETYEFDLVQSTTANLASKDTLLQLPFTNAQAGTLLVAGAILVVPIPPNLITKRFIALRFIGANTPTITVTAWIAPLSMIQEQRYYTSGIVIS